MRRRSTTFLLLMAYVVSQLAAVHAHGAGGEAQSSGHSARPHVHVSWFDHGDHAHEIERPHDHEHEEPRSQGPLSDSTADYGGHDTDAVYLADATGNALPGKDIVSLTGLQFVLALNALALPARTVSVRSGEDWFPDKCSSSCPLYLALRALRI